ncbi:MAG: formamidopyrimidine-DNA glycosylase [bacterium]|nr:formamidopyrimidine-DNA glycosylase [bacterium]MDE0642934.1 formamidopyrimidine-DNA glycosylase [bacterium]MYD04883.1 formamidopyrimidine-DNA glycosylase [Acidimicrobiia bacterium]
MPELPDVVVYLEALERFVGGRRLEKARVVSFSLLRTFDPPLSEVEGRRVVGFHRIGKRLVVEIEGDLFLVFHLMIAGRFRWRKRGAPVPKRVGHAAFDFPNGTLVLTEQGTKKRASLHVHRGEKGLTIHDRGGVEPLEADPEAFARALRRENRTLKRALTDQRILSGIGNAYSDEILHRAGLSPVTLTSRLDDGAIDQLYKATIFTLTEWVQRLRNEVGDGFPEKVTAFRPEMAVHGKYRQPCPVCGDQVRRIVNASNETNYCATCQTKGKILADRALSRLLKT